MKTKLLSLMALLLIGISSAWADVITVTFAYDKINATGTGTASVDGIIGSTSVALVGNYQSFNSTANGSTYNSVVVPKYSKITVSNDGTTSASDYLRFTITPADGYRFTPSSVSLGAIREGTDAGSMTVKANNTTLTESTLSKTSVTPGRNKTGSNADEITKYTKDGYSFSYTISDIDATNDAPLYIDVCMSGLKNKSWGIWNVVITGTYEGTNLTKLGTPTISVNSLTGAVTISDIDANATKVTYTTDGTEPTASSTTYSEPFTVDANCTVKAIAIGDGASYSNSNVASQTAVVIVEDPVIKSYNGTVGITCATEGATIKYNFDNGATWNTYTIPFTLFEGQTVYAKAESASYKYNSGTVNKAVTAAPAAEVGSSSITFYYDDTTNFSLNTDGNSDVLTGKAGTDYEGFSITLDNEGQSGDGIKAISYGSNIDGKTSLKGSNGRKMTIAMPSNLRANRITIKSYNNGAISTTSLWSNVGGTAYTDANEIGLQCVSDASNPDVRVFELNDLTSIDIVNNGVQQQCFIATIDYTKYVPGPADPVVVGGDAITWDFSTYSSKTDLNGSAGAEKTINATDGSGESFVFFTGSSAKIDAKNGTYCLDPNGPTSKNGSVYQRYIRLQVNTSGTFTVKSRTNFGTYKFFTSTTAETLTDALYGSTPATSVTTTSENPEQTTSQINVSGDTYIFIVFNEKIYSEKIVWTPTSSDVTLTTTDNMAGWRAFYDASNSYSVDENTTVYVAKSDPSEGKITLTSIDGIPAGVPVVLHTTSSADSYKMTLTKEDANTYTYEGTNKLEYKTTAVSDVYRLGYGASGVGFYPYSGTPASGAVILIVSSSARALSIAFDEGETTGVVSVGKPQTTSYREVYNLNGQRVAQPTKGLYIVNGRKVVIK